VAARVIGYAAGGSAATHANFGRMPPKKPAKKASASARPPRKMPAFTKPSAETLDAFMRATEGLEGVEPRQMFGYPSVFLNGNMLSCIFQDRIMVRLSEADRATALDVDGAKLFEPSPGRAMKEYIDFPAAVRRDVIELRRWLERGRRYVATLPPKRKKKNKKSK
jgi:TfoX/Sxy family transcriptional regulator of competence genes